MQIPTSWNDRRLLNDEPFLGAFEGFVVGKGMKGLERNITDIVKVLKVKPRINEVMQAWIEYAFIRLPGDKPKASPPGSKDFDIIRLFVEFYSLLARENEDAALIQLNRGRRRRGFSPIKSDEHFQQALAAASTSALATCGRKKKRTSMRIRQRNGVSSSTKLNQQGMPRKIRANGNMESSQGPDTIKSKRKKAPDGVDSRPRKKRCTVNSVNGKHGRVEMSNAPQSHSRTVAIWRPKTREVVGRLTRSKKLLPSPVQLGPTTQIQKKKVRNLKIVQVTADDQRTSRAKQKELRTPQKRPASPNISRERKRRAIGSDNAHSVLEVISSQPDNGPAKRTSTPPLLTVPLSGDRGQQSDLIPLSSRTFSVFSDIGDAVKPAGSDTSSERQSLGCPKRKREPDSNPEQEAADKLEENFKNTLQLRSSREIIPREMQQSPVVGVNTQIVQENSSNFLEADNNLPSEILAAAVLNLQGLSVFNDGEVPEKRSGLGMQDTDTMQNKVMNNTGIDTKVEFFRGPIPLFTEDIVPWTVIPEQESQPSASFVVKVEAASLLPPLQLPLDPVPQMTYKVPLPDFPPIWAQSRQEVCESFDWFRSYQGGVYHVNEMAKGYLLSGFPSSRDRFEHGGRLIISHGGGRAESLHATKGHISSHPASDQLAQDKSVRALLNNYKNKRPLALLIDDKYVLFPYDLGTKDITYAVLGFYTVEHVWAEYQRANNESGHVVRYKFAFRWCEDQGDPWWIPQLPSEKSPQHLSTPYDSSAVNQDPALAPDTDPSSVISRGTNAVSAMRTCETCGNASPRVFHHHWTCLVPECPMFWKQTEGPCAGHFIVSDLNVAKSLLKRNHVVLGTLRNYHFTRGFHCSECGRLSSRYVSSSMCTAELLLLTISQIAMGEMGMCTLPCTYVCSDYTSV
ncbi:hypothetical protein HYPSUDRAFT_62915 [Hypholoma sublateritium FD-334 SS-4]|uniref:Uncharacterized protein n=1 Tax=Hypholoma sublateritium (strain FD-334 SS-4) TaxID=945553 RepID=A0A0D2MV49_HYPSF|nr:hypothetical protein HYPSUDRAFT_62915 [Hypholoma sublateritium FD-334 SS-4]